jgi:hypothetical protein
MGKLTTIFSTGLIGTALFAAAPCFAEAEMSDTELLHYLKDRLAIEDLIARYSVVLDSGDEAGYAALFASDGELTSLGKTYVGPQAIEEGLHGALLSPEEEEAARARGEPVRRLRHLISGVKIDIEGDRGTVRANWVTVAMAPDSRPGIGGMGYFQDEVVKENGQWYFRTHNLIVELQAAPPPRAQ